MMAARAEEYYYYGHGRGDDGAGGTPPHGLLLLAVVLGIAVAGPQVVGEGAGEKVTEALKEMLSPVGFLLLPVSLIFFIRILSSDRGAAVLANVFAFGRSPNAVHRVGGSPVGVALLLLIVVTLLYYKTSSLFGADGGSDG